MVQTATVGSGSQAVAINAVGLPNFTFATHALPYPPELSPNTIVKLRIDMLLTSSANQTVAMGPEI